MKSAFTIAAKDLRRRLRDRSAIVMGVVAPFALAAIFATLMPSDDGGFHADYAVVDLDGGGVAEPFVDQVLPGVAQAGFADLTSLSDRAEAVDRVADGEFSAAFIIPEGFSDAVGEGQEATITVIGNIDSGLGTQIAEAIAVSFSEEVNAVSLSVAAALGGFVNLQDAALAELAGRAAAFDPSIIVEEETADLKQMSSRTFYAASMAIMFLFFTAQFGVLGVLSERREGTLARLVAAPVGPWAIVFGKALTGFILGLLAMVVLIVASTLLLGASWGDPIGVALLVLGAVVSATGVSAMAATMAKTEEQASGWNAILAMSLAILGGTFFSLARAPEFVGNLSLITPHAWFLRGLDELAATTGRVADAVPAFLVMTVIGLITGAIGMMRAKQLVVGR